MQFLVYDPHFDPAQAKMPDPETMRKLGEFTQNAVKSGVVVATGGLAPKGKRLKLSDGKFTVTDGPFIEVKELMGGWAVLRANSLDEVVEWCKQFRSLIGDGETEIVQVFGPES